MVLRLSPMARIAFPINGNYNVKLLLLLLLKSCLASCGCVCALTKPTEQRSGGLVERWVKRLATN